MINLCRTLRVFAFAFEFSVLYLSIQWCRLKLNQGLGAESQKEFTLGTFTSQKPYF